MTFRAKAAATSDVGLVRASNQDSAFVGENILIVADGMGGHAGGDVASSIAIASLDHLNDTTHTKASATEDVEEAFDKAREAIIRATRINPTLHGMGTTVTALLRAEDSLVLAHMGDSRAYLLRDGVLTQITVDHTFVQHLVDTGRITAEEAEYHPQRNVVMRVLGDFDLDLRPDLSVLDARQGDRWMLCSDGLSGYATLGLMQDILASIADPDLAARTLIDAAKEGQSSDNITAVVADIVPDDGEVSPSLIVGAAATGGPQPDLVNRVVLEAAASDAFDDADTGPIPVSELPTAAGSASSPSAPSATARTAGSSSALASPASPPPPPASSVTRQHPASAAESDLETLTEPVADTGSEVLGVLEDDTILIPAYFADDGGKAAPKRHPIVAAVVTVGILAALALGMWQGYRWTQDQYFVGVYQGNVAVFRGIPQTIGPLELSHEVDVTDVAVDTLPENWVALLQDGIPEQTLRDARARAQTIIAESQASAVDPPVQEPGQDAEPTSEPTAEPTADPATSPTPEVDS
ncbi:MAG: protein phosphatase 2C domain-containing protein [Cellulomonadaceae bacterium]|nr:protein phosphatase 2C domain-containing protein [Cellulomonadaceae bacterium]